MAKKLSSENIAEGLFLNKQEEKNVKQIKEEPKEKIVKITKKVGRPKAKDLINEPTPIKTSIYLTEATQMKIDLYAIRNRMDRSEAIRYLIDTYI